MTVTKKQIYSALDLVKGSKPELYDERYLFELVGLKPSHKVCGICGLQKKLTWNTYRPTMYWRYSLPIDKLCKKHEWKEVPR